MKQENFENLHFIRYLFIQKNGKKCLTLASPVFIFSVFAIQKQERMLPGLLRTEVAFFGISES